MVEYISADFCIFVFGNIAEIAQKQSRHFEMHKLLAIDRQTKLLTMERPIDIHTHHPSPSDLAVRSIRMGVEELAGEGLISAGVHPWDVEAVGGRVEELLEALRHAPLAAIGECGADFTIGSDRSLQLDIFERHIGLAKELDLPLVIHCVKAQNEILSILRREHFERAIFHSFIGSTEQAREILKAGCKISFGPRSFASPRTMQALTMLRGEDIFFETDMKSESVAELYEKAAEMRSESVEELMEDVRTNFCEWFSND